MNLEAKIRQHSAHVGIVGLGYVGLPLAVEFAGAGYTVTGIEADPARAEAVQRGTSYIPDVPSEVLSRLVERRTWPAIDIPASGTRKEELLMHEKELELVYRLRRVLTDMNVVESIELLLNRLSKVKTNNEFLMTMNLD